MMGAAEAQPAAVEDEDPTQKWTFAEYRMLRVMQRPKCQCCTIRRMRWGNGGKCWWCAPTSEDERTRELLKGK